MSSQFPKPYVLHGISLGYDVFRCTTSRRRRTDLDRRRRAGPRPDVALHGLPPPRDDVRCRAAAAHFPAGFGVSGRSNRPDRARGAAGPWRPSSAVTC